MIVRTVLVSYLSEAHTGEIVRRLFAETPRQHGFREHVGRVGNLRGCAHVGRDCRYAIDKGGKDNWNRSRGIRKNLKVKNFDANSPTRRPGTGWKGREPHAINQPGTRRDAVPSLIGINISILSSDFCRDRRDRPKITVIRDKAGEPSISQYASPHT